MKTRFIEHVNTSYVAGIEVGNIYFSGLSSVVNVLSDVDGVTNINTRRFLDFASDYDIWFEYKGMKYVVFEPFGDSDCYWITPMEDSDNIDRFIVMPIYEAFAAYKPSILLRLIAYVVTFQIFKDAMCLFDRAVRRRSKPKPK